MSKAKTAKSVSSVESSENIIELSLAHVEADRTWNVRSGDFTKDEDSDGPDQSWSAFVGSIRDNGQETPVVVRPIGRNRYTLVSGFRRFAALEVLAKSGDVRKIKAIVRNLDDLEARAANIRENVERESLKAADLAFGALEIRRMLLDRDEDATDTKVASYIGKSQPYTSKLLRIVTTTNKDILEDWRQRPVAVTIDAMAQVAKVDKDRQAEAYQEAVQGKKAAGRAGQAKAQERRIKERAKLLATLDMAECITIEDFPACFDDLKPKGMKTKEWRPLMKLASEVYNATKSDGADGSEDAEDES